MEKKESSYTVGGMQTVTATRENSVVAPKKLKLELPYDSAIAFLGIYAEKNHHSERNMHPIVTAALFLIVRTWKQLKHPS